MEIKTTSTDKKSLTIEVIGESETIINPIIQKLLDDEHVDYAECITEHPLLANPKIFVRMKKGDAKDAVKRAVKAITKDIDDFESAMGEMTISAAPAKKEESDEKKKKEKKK